MKIPENSALLLVDVQASKVHMPVYDGEEQQQRIKYRMKVLYKQNVPNAPGGNNED